ncbi:MAG TPA: sodium:solute symporter family protein, partial [Spirochaetes bacterium]|nr:sodium:solute symporter family protein [Spirochaetota bacterium]
VKSLSSYFVANRNGSTAAVTGSLIATILGGSSTLGMAGIGYSKGLVGAWWLLSGVIGMAILAFWLSRRIRSMGLYTLPAILEKQYDSPGIKIIASVLISIAWIGIIAGQTIAAGKILSVFWPGNLPLLIIISGTVFIIYTTLGGQYSVIKTDIVQAAVIIVGVFVSAAFGLSSQGGLVAVLENAPVGHGSFPLSPSFDAMHLLGFLFFVGLPYLAGPDIYTRLFSARSPETAKKSAIRTALVLLPLAFAVTLIGVIARVVLPGIPPESAFPALVMKMLPAGWNGLVIAALLAAVMSSADTCLLTTGTIISADIIAPLRRREMNDTSMLLLSRMMVVLIGIVSVFIALILGGIIKSLMLAYTVYSSGVVVPLLLGFYARPLRLNGAGAALAALGGGALGLGLKLGGFGNLVLISLPVSALLLLAGSRLFNLLRKSQ